MRRRRERSALTRACEAVTLVMAVAVAITGCASGERAAQQRELSTLRGQLEETRKGQETQARELARLAGEMKALDAQSAFVIAEVKASSEERASVKAAIAESSAALRELQSTVERLGKTVTGPPAAPALSPAGSAEELYATAMASLKAEEHARAVNEFREVTTRFPGDPLASSAQYWIGEAYYRQRDFPEAMTQFQTVIDRYPASAQVPEALLKIGLCHRALKDQARARVAWEQVAKDFPGTNAASQASSLLTTLGSGGTPTQ